MKEIIIVGGGASGMIAAILCAAKGLRVTLLEHNEKIGRKLLATGNGKCNFTNEYQDEACYRGKYPDLAWKLYLKWGKAEYLSFLKELGIYPKNRNGYYYPYSEQAATMANALLAKLNEYKVKLKLNEHVEKIETTENGYRVYTKTYAYEAGQVVLACGGKSYSTLGSDGSGYSLAKQLGHTVTPLFPALVGLKCEKYNKKLQGIRVKAGIRALKDKSVLSQSEGELQLTAYGISGIPVFQVSRYVAELLQKGEKAEVSIQFLPELTSELFEEYKKEQIHLNPDKTIHAFLSALMDEKLAEEIIVRTAIKKSRRIAELTDAEWLKLERMRLDYRLFVYDTAGFEQAQVTAGGISMTEVNPDTLESKLHKGLYFCGEILDVDGTCGGYNLQWAFTSAAAVSNQARK